MGLLVNGPIGNKRALRLGLESAIIIALPLFAVANVWYPLVPLQERSLVAAMALVAFFLTRTAASPVVQAFDLVCAVLSAVAFGYVAIN